MPFHGVPPRRAWLFRPEPAADVAVSDAAAWRLNPAHRWVYNKLELALSQGLIAAPAGVEPREMGLAADEPVFVRPITNLAGMSLGAYPDRAGSVAPPPGSFWSERLVGEQSSTDCLVRDGEALWFAHTVAGDEWVDGRPLYWRVGVERPANEALIAEWVAANLPGYTGITNFEVIGDTIIEAHLRGSNGFYEHYGDDFLPAWVELVDRGHWNGLDPVPGGYILSLFTEEAGPFAVPEGELPSHPGVAIQADTDAAGRPTHGRVAILRSRDLDAGRAALAELAGRMGVPSNTCIRIN
ncbi:hypothetical protein SAMN05660831_02517 [Thiohalospira halophila DSM 15071]|uniref:ATP-grasp domain-containing protein n=1 Tax=Thiohalospira halophila DSM 15071 TaxID=1123397 RepID=A0A1I1W5C0_9GAMM|nr:hypothetical protein [Thiohalospira halophila]SFD88150.1 hypothetical protein SAMN05660831_02517 [Thiohalospira halophila DSM 15071]